MLQQDLAQTLRYCPDPYRYQRRQTREVAVGKVGVGGTNPIRVQSMTTTRTQDVEATLAQVLRLVEVGCEIVRITAPTVQDARAIGAVRAALRRRGVEVPLVADIHFSPEAALEAAEHVDKVRINPGNYADARRFQVREYSDQEYAAELARVGERFAPLVLACQRRGIALRIGTNHGSLSDRIVNRFGDTPLGMVESALEFVRLCAQHDYHDLILSMKASNPKVMVQAYRLLVARLDTLGLRYPLHLGVTEAGSGEDGRIKSAIGIGALLDDGLGDTVRVSLTEAPEAEVPVAFELARPYNESSSGGTSQVHGSTSGVQGEHRLGLPTASGAPLLPDVRDPFAYRRRASRRVALGALAVGGGEPVRVVAARQGEVVRWAEPRQEGAGLEFVETPTPLLEVAGQDFVAAAERLAELAAAAAGAGAAPLLALRLPGVGPTVRGYRLLSARLAELGLDLPLHLVFDARAGSDEQRLLWASVALGSLLGDGLGDSVEVHVPGPPGARARLAYSLLQGAGVRPTRTEFVACPSCGRTLFDLQTTTERIKARTGHLAGLKIAIMGCIVNGPGEMADADFGYVGGAPGRVNLYVGRELVERNVPEAEADVRLIDLVKRSGRWVEPPRAS
ncbi:MAG: (E)-4-hydroxy-3-methylbut-2-enyl-diphosphate synthase [Chloroflexi bacterium]|nr:(E)-4-hydroxy-3-methylbut-2-enyl-diphosphate synthase [Chloroflexota bacterium]